MNHAVSLEQAIQMTTRYREQKERIVAPEFTGAGFLPQAETFDRAAIDKLLSQPGCTGLRIYFGMNEELQVRVILVGVNGENKDILPEDRSKADGAIVEDGKVCPPFCAPDSPLNA